MVVLSESPLLRFSNKIKQLDSSNNVNVKPITTTNLLGGFPINVCGNATRNHALHVTVRSQLSFDCRIFKSIESTQYRYTFNCFPIFMLLHLKENTTIRYLRLGAILRIVNVYLYIRLYLRRTAYYMLRLHGYWTLKFHLFMHHSARQTKEAKRICEATRPYEDPRHSTPARMYIPIEKMFY